MAAMSTEKKVGIFFLLTLVALGVMIELVQDWHPFEHFDHYRALFHSTVGLKVGDPVRQAGVEVGKVKSIDIDGTRVRVEFTTIQGTRIHGDSVARIRQTNLLGGTFLGLDFGSAASPVLAPGSVVRTEEATNIDQLISDLDRNQEKILGNLNRLIEQTRGPLIEVVKRLDDVAGKVDRGEGTLGRLVNDPALYDQLRQATGSLKTILARIDRGQGTLGQLVNDPTLYREASAAVANLRLITDRVKSGQGTIGRLFNDEHLYDNANATLVNLRAIAEKANHGQGTLAKLLNDGKLYDETTSTMTHLNSITTKVDKGDGTLGRIVNDDNLYRDARTTLNKVEKAVDGLSDTGPMTALGQVVGTLF